MDGRVPINTAGIRSIQHLLIVVAVDEKSHTANEEAVPIMCILSVIAGSMRGGKALDVTKRQ